MNSNLLLVMSTLSSNILPIIIFFTAYFCSFTVIQEMSSFSSCLGFMVSLGELRSVSASSGGNTSLFILNLSIVSQKWTYLMP